MMAERAFETPQHFSKYVVTPNIDLFRERPDSLQAAFNCVMSVDALAAHIFFLFLEHGKTDLNDDSLFRAELASECEHYKIIRDTAKTYKHIELGRGRPIVKFASQTKLAARPYGSGVYGVGNFDSEDVMIELNDGSAKHCISEAIDAHRFLTSKFEG